MKAVSLIEFIVSTDWKAQGKLLDYIGLPEVPNKTNIRIYADFLNQPFKLELIVERFKGWDNMSMTQSSKNYANNYGTISIDTDRIFLRGNCGKFTIQNTIPRTLSDFINDCQRAGIELEFKEQ